MSRANIPMSLTNRITKDSALKPTRSGFVGAGILIFDILEFPPADNLFQITKYQRKIKF